MTEEDFMVVTDHFAQLVTRLEPKVLALYNSTKHVRVETAFRGRQFVIYRMEGRDPKVIDRVTVLDFICNDEQGSTAEIKSETTGQTLTLGYSPVQVPGHAIFLSLPLHGKIRWSASPSNIDSGSLGFPVVIRTMSRLHLRERGVTYMESGTEFGKEFDAIRSR